MFSLVAVNTICASVLTPTRPIYSELFVTLLWWLNDFSKCLSLRLAPGCSLLEFSSTGWWFTLGQSLSSYVIPGKVTPIKMQLMSSKRSAIASSVGTAHTPTSRVTPEGGTRESCSPRENFCACSLGNAGNILCHRSRLEAGGEEGNRTEFRRGDALQSSETWHAPGSRICSRRARSTGAAGPQGSSSLVARLSSQRQLLVAPKADKRGVSRCFWHRSSAPRDSSWFTSISASLLLSPFLLDTVFPFVPTKCLLDGKMKHPFRKRLMPSPASLHFPLVLRIYPVVSHTLGCSQRHTSRVVGWISYTFSGLQASMV